MSLTEADWDFLGYTGAKSTSNMLESEQWDGSGLQMRFGCRGVELAIKVGLTPDIKAEPLAKASDKLEGS